MNPQFPIYIVSKGRHESRLTSRALEKRGVPYFIIVEAQELDLYAAVIDRKKILVLDPAYQRDYDTFDDLGESKGRGAGPARNFAWDHSVADGHAWHWVMDDNIRGFWRLNRNRKVPTGDGTPLRCIEDFTLRYKNVGMAGPNYYMFGPRKNSCAVFTLNTRIYSCNLIRNDIPFRWRGRYNEDTDLSLRILKSRQATILFNAFLQQKTPTLTMKGGNTDTIYAEGTEAKSRMLVAMHPDVTTLVWKFGRKHHLVDYKPFKRIPLIRHNDQEVRPKVDEYQMKIAKKRK